MLDRDFGVDPVAQQAFCAESQLGKPQMFDCLGPILVGRKERGSRSAGAARGQECLGYFPTRAVGSMWRNTIGWRALSILHHGVVSYMSPDCSSRGLSHPVMFHAGVQKMV